MSDFSAAVRTLSGIASALLGWRPDEFWQATPDELVVVLRALADTGEVAAGPADRATLHHLKEMFPDG